MFLVHCSQGKLEDALHQLANDIYFSSLQAHRSYAVYFVPVAVVECTSSLVGLGAQSTLPKLRQSRNPCLAFELLTVADFARVSDFAVLFAPI